MAMTMTVLKRKSPSAQALIVWHLLVIQAHVVAADSQCTITDLEVAYKCKLVCDCDA